MLADVIANCFVFDMPNIIANILTMLLLLDFLVSVITVLEFLIFFLLADVITSVLCLADLIATYCGCFYTNCIYFFMSLSYVLADVIFICGRY